MGKVLIFAILALATISCGTYRGSGSYKTGAGDYQGMGGYKTPSDYSPSRPPDYNPDGPFTLAWPVKRGRVSQGFSPNRNQKHQGIDIPGSRGSDILAAHDGFVVFAGRGYKGYGKMVILEFNKKWASLYAHLNQINVREGQVVNQGDSIGKMGNTGRTTGVHLHFELLQNKQPIDPLKYLKVPKRWVSR